MVTVMAQRNRWLWMTVGELAAIAVFTVPSLFYSAGSTPPTIVVAQVLVGGLLLGCGRQGIDLLAIRVLLAFSAVFVITELDHTATQVACSGAADCVRLTLIAVLGLGLVSAFFGVVVIPVTMIWNRGVRSLTPEFAWHRLPLRTRRQWVVVVLVGVILLVALYLLLGIPAR